MRRRRLEIWLVAGALGWSLPSPVAAGVGAPAAQRPCDRPEPTLRELAERRTRAKALQDKAVAAFNAKDYAAAEGFLRAQLKLEPGNPVPLYNLASVRAVLGDTAEAGELLKRAIEHGFVDHTTLTTDQSLAPLHGTPTYEAILDHWQEIVDARSGAQLDAARKKYGPRYHYTRDADLRLSFASAFDDETFAVAHDELRLITRWALDSVLTDLREPPMGATDPWVLVVLPTERDFTRWAIAAFGPQAVASEFHRVGGSYSHDQKQLVAMDLGGTFRHEFFHVLHWRSNARAGFAQPIWIQEGLASLVEDYDITPDGSLVPAPSWRTNMIKRIARSGRLVPMARFAAMSRSQFSGTRPLANYAQARAFFMFLDQRGELGAWYAHALAHFEDDPTGIASVEAVLGKPIEQVDKDLRDWLADLPEAPEARTDGRITGVSASIGAQVEAGGGDGPVVRGIRLPNARKAGLRRGDIITAIDERPTRDMNDFVRVLGSYAPGQTVELAVRRGARHTTLTLELVRMR